MEVYMKHKDGGVHICYSEQDLAQAKAAGYTQECGPGGLPKKTEAPTEAPKKRGRPKKTEE